MTEQAAIILGAAAMVVSGIVALVLELQSRAFDRRYGIKSRKP